MAILKAANEMAEELGMKVSSIQELRNFVRKMCDLTDAQIQCASLTCMGEWLGIL